MTGVTMEQNRSQVDIAADKIRDNLIAKGETLENMLAILREERERHDGAPCEIGTPGNCLTWHRDRWR